MNTNSKKRGRPAGSVSFENVTLAELNARFGQDQVIPVGRLFLTKGQAKQSTQTVAAQVIPQPATPAVEMSLSE
jgi:hypothetical protein